MTGILRRHETENVTEGIRLYKDRGRGWSDVVASWGMPSALEVGRGRKNHHLDYWEEVWPWPTLIVDARLLISKRKCSYCRSSQFGVV